MKTKTILSASNVSELKACGSYFDVKKSLEIEIDNKLGVSGWESLYFRIQSLKKIVPLKKEYLASVCEKKSFGEGRKELSNILDVELKAKDLDELKRKIELIVSVFGSKVFDPYAYYEKTKLSKFKGSSRLEGINIEYPDVNASLESVLAKYRR